MFDEHVEKRWAAGGGKRAVGDEAGGEAVRPRTSASQGVGASGVKRECGKVSPSGSTIAARAAEEVEELARK